MLLSYTALPAGGSNLVFQVIVPKDQGCTAAIARKEARRFATYLEEKLEHAD